MIMDEIEAGPVIAYSDDPRERIKNELLATQALLEKWRQRYEDLTGQYAADAEAFKRLQADRDRAEAERDGALRRLEQTRAELTDANAERTKLALENARLRQGRPVDPPDSVR